MLLAAVVLTCNPDLVIKLSSLLAILMLKRTGGVQTRIELAHGLDMRKLAILRRAVCTIATQRHGWMAEWTSRICAVWKELAVLFGLMGKLLCW